MAGTRGPIPKRESQRRRRNAPEGPPLVEAPTGEPAVPDPDAGWHPVARRWFDSLGESGQSAFYTSSDWMTAYVVAESMSRALNSDEPIPGSTLTAWRAHMATLLVTEGDRRRAAMELTRPKPDDGGGDVARIDDYRHRPGAV